MSDDFKVCNSLSADKRQYCKDLIYQCTKGLDPIVLDTYDGNKTNFQSQTACKNFAIFRAKLGTPEDFPGNPKTNGDKHKEDRQGQAKNKIIKSETDITCSNLSFVEADDSEDYSSKVNRKESLAIGQLSISQCSFAKNSKCKIPNPQNEQFIDDDGDEICDRDETKFVIQALFEGGFAYLYPFELNRIGEAETAFVPMKEILLYINTEDGKCKLKLLNPAVSKSEPATHVKNFVVQDLNGDGLFDVAFTLVSLYSTETSLKVFLQQEE